jgi:general secretion pathway protein D
MMKHERIRTVLLLLGILSLAGCAGQSAYRHGQEASKRGDVDRAVAYYLQALHEKGDNPQYRATFERARLLASQFHFQKAKELAVSENYEQSIIEFQIALNFDPTNQYISNELHNVRVKYDRKQNEEQLTAIEKAKADAKKNMRIYQALGPEAQKTIESLKFHDDSLKHIMDSLGALVGINIVYDSDFRDQEFTVALDNITFRNALDQILVANHLYFKPLDQSTILVIPDNPQKRRQYDEQVIQTFYLSNAELNDVLNLIRSVMQIQRIATNPQLNAITLRDTPDKIAIAQKIIEANDKSRSEVLLDVEILEIDRDSALTYGVDLSSYAVQQSLVVNGATTSGTTTTSNAGQFYGNQLGAIDSASWSFLVPGITYNALATDQRNKILAKPQIRASEGQQVTVRLGDRVPIPVQNTGVPVGGGGTFVTQSFQQQDIGINIDVTPRVHHNKEITLTMRFELTSITAPGTGVIPPTIGNRTVNTVIRLKDGETNLLAGLLRRDERKSLRGLPGISKIPIIRDLFAANERDISEKDIVFTITPHILRTPNITETDLEPIWIGTEDNVTLKNAPPISVFERQEMENQEAARKKLEDETPEEPAADEQAPPQKPEAPVVQPEAPPVQQNLPVPEASEEEKPQAVPQQGQPQTPAAPETASSVESQKPSVVTPVEAPPPQSEEGQEAPTGSAAAISFASPNVSPRVNTDIVLNVMVDNAQAAGSVALLLHFDPDAVQVKDVLQGAFMTPGAFTKSYDNNRGTLSINAGHQPGATASGVLATIVLHSLRPGKTTIQLESAVVRDVKAVVIPVTFFPYTMAVE